MTLRRWFLVTLLLTGVATACLAGTAAAYPTAKHCTASSAKLGLHRYGPAACVMQFRCAIPGGCAIYPRASVRPWFIRGQMGSIRMQATFVPLSQNLYPGTGTEPQSLTCTAPRPSDSNYGFCIAYGKTMHILENEIVGAICQAPVNPYGLLVLPPRDVWVQVECAINAYPLF